LEVAAKGMPRSLTGAEAPHFELLDTRGRAHRPGDHRGRWLLLVFHRHLH
jgi:peroxiredoxin